MYRVLLAVAVLAFGGVTADGLAMRDTGSPARAARPAILFVGGPGSLDAAGRRVQPGLYAVDAVDGNLKQLVSGAAARARWSPDGRSLAFVRSPDAGPPSLYVVNSRGGTPRRVARSGWFSWSPNSKRIAYSQGGAIYVAPIAGGRRRLVTRRGRDFVSWSPDGRTIAFVGNDNRLYAVNVNGSRRRRLAKQVGTVQPYLSWAPDGTKLAFYPCCLRGAAVVNLVTGRVTTLVGRGVMIPSWAPNGKLIALGGQLTTRSGTDLEGTFLIRPDGTGLRRISTFGGSPFTPAWSPDSRQLATEDRCCSPDIEVFSVTGRNARRLTEGWRYGYGNDDPQWQPAARGTATLGGRYVSAAYPTDTLVGQDVVETREPVERLAADGAQVAYATTDWCESWDEPSAAVTRINGCGAPSYSAGSYPHTYGPAFAGGALAWSTVGSFMGGDNWTVMTASVDVPAVEQVIFPGVSGTLLRDEPVTALAGAGDLLVLSTWGPCPIFYTPTSACVHMPKQDGTLWRVDGRNAVKIASSAGALTPLAVDAGRILVDHENGTLELMGSDGSTLQTFPVDASHLVGAAVQGTDVVVLESGEIDDYDAGSGALLHTWPLPAGDGQLAGVQNGIAAYVSGTDVHLLRLADGKDVAVHAPGAGPVLAQLDAAGLFYSYTASDTTRPGRIAFVPFDGLPPF